MPVFVSVCVMLFPVPALCPEMFGGLLTVQLKDAPETVELNNIFVWAAEQIVSDNGVADKFGAGLTVIVYVLFVPAHETPVVVACAV